MSLFTVVTPPNASKQYNTIIHKLQVYVLIIYNYRFVKITNNNKLYFATHFFTEVKYNNILIFININDVNGIII